MQNDPIKSLFSYFAPSPSSDLDESVKPDLMQSKLDAIVEDTISEIYEIYQ